MEDSVDPVAPPPSEVPPEQFAEFASMRKRLAAFVLDGLVLASVGSVLGFIAREPLIGMGSWSRLVGFAIAVAYFGALGSRWGRGQTLGMRALGIRIVDLNGSPLTAGKSAIRAAVLLLPMAVNGWFISGSTPGATAIGMVSAALLFGLGPALVVVAVFNRPSHRSLHDFVVGSVVVRASPGQVRPVPSPVPQLALMGTAAWIAVLLLTIIVTGLHLGDGGPASELVATWRELESIPGVASATLMQNTTTFFNLGKDGSNRRRTSLVATLWTRAAESEVKRISYAGAAVIRADLSAPKVDSVIVRVCRGYSLGFWAWSDCSMDTDSGR